MKLRYKIILGLTLILSVLSLGIHYSPQKLGGYNINPSNKNDAIITEGLIVRENSVPDLDVRYSAGVIRNDGNYYYTDTAGTASVTAATAGNSKLAILQKAYNSTSTPTVKDGNEIGTGSTNLGSGTNAGADRQIYESDSGGYAVWQAIGYTNNSGTDYTIDLVRAWNPTGANVTNKLYSASDNGGVPDWDNKTDQGNDSANSNSQLEWSSLSIALNDGETIWLIIGNISTSLPLLDNNIKMPYASSGSPSFASGITSVSYFSKSQSNPGESWTNNNLTTPTWQLVRAGAAQPSYPDPDANNIIIGKIGEPTTPIDENTTTVVEGTPGANEVELIPVNTNRL